MNNRKTIHFCSFLDLLHEFPLCTLSVVNSVIFFTKSQVVTTANSIVVASSGIREIFALGLVSLVASIMGKCNTLIWW